MAVVQGCMVCGCCERAVRLAPAGLRAAQSCVARQQVGAGERVAVPMRHLAPVQQAGRAATSSS